MKEMMLAITAGGQNFKSVIAGMIGAKVDMYKPEAIAKWAQRFKVEPARVQEMMRNAAAEGKSFKSVLGGKTPMHKPDAIAKWAHFFDLEMDAMKEWMHDVAATGESFKAMVGGEARSHGLAMEKYKRALLGVTPKVMSMIQDHVGPEWVEDRRWLARAAARQGLSFHQVEGWTMRFFDRPEVMEIMIKAKTRVVECQRLLGRQTGMSVEGVKRILQSDACNELLEMAIEDLHRRAQAKGDHWDAEVLARLDKARDMWHRADQELWTEETGGGDDSAGRGMQAWCDLQQREWPLFCKTCGTGFKTAEQKQAHRTAFHQKHGAAHECECDVCHHVFDSPHDVVQHKWAHHGVWEGHGSLQCTFCPYTCDTHVDFIAHADTHHKVLLPGESEKKAVDDLLPYVCHYGG